MEMTLPFLSSYDPQGSGEGSIDPLGLYQIADQLAVELVPAVRERMQRVRFLTAIAIGALVTEDLEDDPRYRDASPSLVWEWLAVSALVEHVGNDPNLVGVAGSDVVRRALAQRGYVDARSYLKTARIFGFNGIYKRLAVQLGLVDVHLGPGPQAERLVVTWARSANVNWPELRRRWRDDVKRSLDQKPPRTKTTWTIATRGELAQACAPHLATGAEKSLLRTLLVKEYGDRLGALPAMMSLQHDLADDDYSEYRLQTELERIAPVYGPLVGAIRDYERFARLLEDGFDSLRAASHASDGSGIEVASVAKTLFSAINLDIDDVSRGFARAAQSISSLPRIGTTTAELFERRFARFSAPMSPQGFAEELCNHHESIQRGKSADGKRPWFDRLSSDRIYVRQSYRIPPLEALRPDYVHAYRAFPIRRFHTDLT